MEAFSAAFGHLALAYDANVEKAQRLLNQLGYGPLKVDGLLGPETRAAMQKWAARHNFSWSGSTVSPSELARMEKDLSAIKIQKSGGSSMSTETASSTSTGEKPTSGDAKSDAKPPLFKAFPWVTPTVLAGGIIVLSLVGYLWWRSKQKGSLFGLDGEEGDVWESPCFPRESARTRCSRAPSVDFSEGEEVKA
jgi:hypothetical protein